MPFCLIGLGSNVGDRHETLRHAVSRLNEHPQIAVVAQSRLLETAPIGGPTGQGPFVNGVLSIETSLAPQSLLELTGRVESELGRRRTGRWAPRTVDLDLLLYDDLVLDTPTLALPHPRMAWRRFVLEGAVEVAPAMLHPTTGWTISRLWDHLNTAVPYVAIAGSIGVGKTQLAKQLEQRTSLRWIAERPDATRLDAFYANPAGNAWDMEIEFLGQRTRLLAADSADFDPRRQWTVSDFWFDQSAAFAEVWLPADRLEAFLERWHEARARVARPKLIVLLEAPAEELLRRVQRRGRPGEQTLTAQQLQRIARAIADRANRPDQGPVMKLAAEDTNRILDEVHAAMQAMW
ncbi:MAG: 2-amino-4-hydroxy-6-hydroxymethyldihydropteridine diphosphokinase [Candidatus Nealsonbacteria bacterium]|nr:2-amino-4-hydroxy-6-hydroxymethyldihydropteridine diphosphokinase [Candidatus Nealsonbacteria bacterium]